MRILNILFLFVTMISMLIVGMAGEGVKVVFEKVKNYELPREPFAKLLREFRSHSKPAYY